MVHVNYVAVLVAAVAVFVLGWLWYSPLLFFKPWMRLRGMDPVAAMAGAKMPAGKLLIELVRCLVLACVIAPRRAPGHQQLDGRGPLRLLVVDRVPGHHSHGIGPLGEHPLEGGRNPCR